MGKEDKTLEDALGSPEEIGGENKKKLSKFLEKEQGGFRKLDKFWYVIASTLSLILVLFYLYGSGVAPVSDQYHRGIYILITFLLVFIFFPFVRSGSAIVSYSTSVALNIAIFVLFGWWISSSFGVSVEGKEDLGYVVYYAVGVIIFTYVVFVVRNISSLQHKAGEGGVRSLVNYVFLGVSILLSLYWLYEFSFFISGAEVINKESASSVAAFVGYNMSLGTARICIGWFLTIAGVVTFIYYFAKPFLPSRYRVQSMSRPILSDIVFIFGSFIAVGYWVFIYVELASRVGLENDFDFLISVIGVIISLEVTRRVLGWSLTIFGLVFLLYSFFGAYDFIPGLLQHGGNSLKEVFVSVFINKSGTFGIMAYVLATYVILFIFFGAFLERSGSTNFFIEFALAAAGKRVGGPAKVAVISSALFGSISGSAIANTVSTGIFTIPLMKRAGFRPHVAGAIEPSASIAGMFLPPVMGAGGFIMAEMTETAYSTIMIIAIFPALMYILGVFAMIHFEAKKYHLTGMDEDKIQNMMELLKREGYLALPLIVITWLMVRAYSPGYAAFYGIISCILVSLAHKSAMRGSRILVFSLLPIPIKIGIDIIIYIFVLIAGLSGEGLVLQYPFIASVYGMSPSYIFLVCGVIFLLLLFIRSVSRLWSLELFTEIFFDTWHAMQNGARQTLIIGATVGVIGIIVGVIYQTGIGLKFSQIILHGATIMAEGFTDPVSGFFGLFGVEFPDMLKTATIVFTVILIAFASLVLGMGVPVTAAYVITVSLVSVALQELGVALIAVHMIVYWFSQDSNITPPVCIAAYAGAAIAGSNPWKTGWTAFKFAKMLYVMPLLFAFVPEVLLTSLPTAANPDGIYFGVSIWRVLLVFTATICGTIAFSALTQGFLARKTRLWEFLLLIPITLLCYWPSAFTIFIGVGLFLMLYFVQSKRPIDPIPVSSD